MKTRIWREYKDRDDNKGEAKKTSRNDKKMCANKINYIYMLWLRHIFVSTCTSFYSVTFVFSHSMLYLFIINSHTTYSTWLWSWMWKSVICQIRIVSNARYSAILHRKLTIWHLGWAIVSLPVYHNSLESGAFRYKCLTKFLFGMTYFQQSQLLFVSFMMPIFSQLYNFCNYNYYTYY